ncbi:MAG: hypothetical protein JSS66_17035 [Armatimonadetes bacterium]|nr:hypothetical protein [Armatimonadota bacterium]
MALDEDAKRRAVSAVAAVRDDIHRVITYGTTGYDVFGQPRFQPLPEAPELPFVEQLRHERSREALVQEIQGKLRGPEAPGE